mmetsp:Transcript_3172/g.9168  ORF Transcript_3172/g.9168 Transcript_3172/m.9168 type:complete len:236 (-) Transcript_3172:3189-3896(-)
MAASSCPVTVGSCGGARTWRGQVPSGRRGMQLCCLVGLPQPICVSSPLPPRTSVHARNILRCGRSDCCQSLGVCWPRRSTCRLPIDHCCGPSTTEAAGWPPPRLCCQTKPAGTMHSCERRSSRPAFLSSMWQRRQRCVMRYWSTAVRQRRCTLRCCASMFLPLAGVWQVRTQRLLPCCWSSAWVMSWMMTASLAPSWQGCPWFPWPMADVARCALPRTADLKACCILQPSPTWHS